MCIAVILILLYLLSYTRKVFVLFKGFHYSHILPQFYWGRKKFTADIIFDENCLYNLTENKHQINKGFGVSSGFNDQKESIRLGWDGDGEKISLYIYCHINGKLLDWNEEKFKVFDCNPNDTINFELFLGESYYIWKVKKCDKNGVLIDQKSGTQKRGIIKNFGWILLPYFGGKIAAPHKMKVIVKKHFFI